MSVSKQRMAGAVGWGVFALGVAVLGWMIYSAWSNLGAMEDQGLETEGEDGPVEVPGLAKEREAFDAHQNANPYPNKVSIAMAGSNGVAFAGWSAEAVGFISRADRKFDVASGAMLQEMIKAAVKGMATLRNGTIASDEFKFGFDEWVDKIVDSEDVRARLMVRLDTVTNVVGLLDRAGVLEIREVRLIEPAAEEGEGDAARKPAPKAKPAKEAPAFTDDVMEYGFKVATRPAGFVAMLNALTAADRFYEVKNLSFSQMFDRIADSISRRKEDKEKAAQGRVAATEGRGRRRRGAALAPQPAEDPKSPASRIVVDLESDADRILVDFTLAVHDFGRAGNRGDVAGGPSAQAKTGDTKGDK